MGLFPLWVDLEMRNALRLRRSKVQVFSLNYNLRYVTCLLFTKETRANNALLSTDLKLPFAATRPSPFALATRWIAPLDIRCTLPTTLLPTRRMLSTILITMARQSFTSTPLPPILLYTTPMIAFLVLIPPLRRRTTHHRLRTIASLSTTIEPRPPLIPRTRWTMKPSIPITCRRSRRTLLLQLHHQRYRCRDRMQVVTCLRFARHNLLMARRTAF